MRRALLILVPILMLISAGAAVAADRSIELRTVAETDIKVIDAAGKEQTERVTATKIVPGDEVIYTVYFTNRGSDATDDVVITNPVPEHMFVRQIETSQRPMLVVVSVDGGSQYGSPRDLTITDAGGRTRPAQPSDYTHVRWTLQEPLAPGAEGSVSFRAQLQ
jgi:uncharacterized repeat protein (TIGR01451 family)